MSNAGQAIVTVVGTVVGAYFGYPQLGFVLGELVGQTLFPTQLPGVTGPRIEDLRTTTSVVGSPVFITYGTIAVPGTIMWVGPLKTITNTETLGGKGGPEQKSTTFTYTQSIALGLAEEISGISRVWENGELVYDVRPQSDDESDLDYYNRSILSAAYAATFTLYLGTEDQLPDPTIELDKGIGNTPAFRGISYIVWHDRELQQKQGLRHPNFKVETFTSGVISCDEGVEYSNEVIYPWVQDGTPDPRNPLNHHQYQWFSGATPTVVSTFAEAVQAQSDNDGVAWLPTIHAWSYGNFNTTAPYPYIDGIAFPETDHLYLHLNVMIPSQYYGLLPPAVGAGPGYSLPCSAFASLGAGPGTMVWWSGRSVDYPNAALANYGGNGLYMLHDICGNGVGQPDIYVPPLPDNFSITQNDCTIFGTSCGDPAARPGVSHSVDRDISVQRIPRPPDAPCSPLAGPVPPNYPGNTDFCVVNGTLESKTPWELDTGHTYRVLQKFHFDNDGNVVYPLNPALPDNHPDFNNQPFWDAAYAAAVTAGLMESGLHYNDTYGATTTAKYKRSFTRCTVTTDGISIASVVQDLCERVSLTDIDVSDIEDKVIRGYAITQITPARQCIDPLRSVGFFDVVESDAEVKFTLRGKPSVAQLTVDDLGAHVSGDSPQPSVRTRKLQDVELPRIVRVHYLSEARDYEPGQQASPTRLTTDAVNEVDVQLPLVIDDTAALQTAEVLWSDAWAARWNEEFELMGEWWELDPADCIDVPIDGRLQRVRIVSIEDSSIIIRQITAVRDDGNNYVSTAVAAEPQRRPNVFSFTSPTGLVLLDLPALRDEDSDAGFYFAVYPTAPSGQWLGASVFRSSDSGVTFGDSLATIGEAAVYGTVVIAAGIGITTTFDSLNTIVVDLVSGDLESRTQLAVFEGANAAAVGVDGRWELVQWLDAVEIAPNRYRLSNLLRGRKGTEFLVGTGIAGDKFVVLSGIGRLSLQTSEVNQEFTYRSVTISTPFSTGTDQTFTGRAVALRPYSPVYINVAKEDNGDFTITWIRRGRLSQELRSGMDIPLSETSEAYDVDIFLNGDATIIKRTLSVTEQTATYTLAQQNTDFASVPPDDLNLAVYQKSGVTGRGIAGAYPPNLHVISVGEGLPEPEGYDPRSEDLTYLDFVKGTYPGSTGSVPTLEFRTKFSTYVVDMRGNGPGIANSLIRFDDGSDDQTGGLGAFDTIAVAKGVGDDRYMYIAQLYGGNGSPSAPGIIRKLDTTTFVPGGILAGSTVASQVATLSGDPESIVILGSFVYAACPYSQTIMKMNASDLSLVATLSTEWRAWTLMVSPAGDLWALERQRPAKCFKVNTSTGATITSFTAADYPIDGVMVGTSMYMVSADEAKCVEFNFNTGARITDFSMGYETFASLRNYLTLDGTLLSFGRSPVHIIDTLTDTVIS